MLIELRALHKPGRGGGCITRIRDQSLQFFGGSGLPPCLLATALRVASFRAFL